MYILCVCVCTCVCVFQVSTENAHAATRVLESYQSDASTKINYIDFLAAAMCKYVITSHPVHRLLCLAVLCSNTLSCVFSSCCAMFCDALFVSFSRQSNCSDGRIPTPFSLSLTFLSSQHQRSRNCCFGRLDRRIAIDEERLVLAFETLDVESKGV